MPVKYSRAVARNSRRGMFLTAVNWYALYPNSSASRISRLVRGWGPYFL